MEQPPGPESSEFQSVCRQARAWEFISKFPNKQCVRGLRVHSLTYSLSVNPSIVNTLAQSLNHSGTPSWAVPAA